MAKELGSQLRCYKMGKIIPGERRVKGSKSQSHMESWKGEVKITWRSGQERRKRSQTFKKSTIATTGPNQLFWKVVTV